MSDATLLSIGATVILGCGTVIWFFVRRLIGSIDRQTEVLDILVEKAHNLETRIVKLEVLTDVA